MQRCVRLLVSWLLVASSACGGKAKLGEACADEGSGQCVDATLAMRCSSGRWEPLPCTGPRGCVDGAKSIECDHTLASDGDSCGKLLDNSFACSKDRRAQLHCEGGTWRLSQKCEGPNGCEPAVSSVKCDDSVASPGDVCQKTDTARFACSADKKTRLKCADGAAWKVEHKCLGSDGCRASSLFVDCDVSISDVGDACEETGVACGTDGTSILDCKNGRLAPTKSCAPKRCIAKPEAHCGD